MINPPIPEAVPIRVTCNKCGHTGEIILPPEIKKQTNRLRCSQCSANGWDIVITYLNTPNWDN